MQTAPDVGSGMCCKYVLLPLVNKDAAFGQWPNRVKPSRKSKQRCRERVGRVREMPHDFPARGERREPVAETLLVSHDLVVMHRLMDMG